jgi:hypothetical protein
MATNEIGGKSRRPSLMASQVELQTAQSVSQAIGMRQLGFAVVFTRARPSRGDLNS